MMYFSEVFIVTVGVFASSMATWLIASGFHSLSHKDISAWKIFRSGAYKYFGIKRFMLAILIVITLFFFVSAFRNGDEYENMLLLSLALYFIYGAACCFESIKAANAYIAELRHAQDQKAADQSVGTGTATS